MNKLNIIFIIVISIYLFNCSSLPDKSSESKSVIKEPPIIDLTNLHLEKWTLAKNGLNIREQPDIKSLKIKNIPFGSKVVVLKQRDRALYLTDTEIQTAIYGYWFYIEWEKFHGWVFGGYLGNYEDYQKIKYEEIVSNFIKNPFLKKITFQDNPRENIINQFGKPIQNKKEKIANRHNTTVTDYTYKIDYVGLSFIIYHISFNNKQVLILTEITNDNYKYNYGLNFKMKKADIINIFYEPDLKDDKVFHYFNKEQTDQLFFYFNNKDLLEKIKIQYYFD